jgi:hypothetical protein
MTDDQAWEAERLDARRAYQVAWNMAQRASLEDYGFYQWRLKRLSDRMNASERERRILGEAYDRAIAK